MKRPEKVRTSLDDAIPSRAVLKCHCGQPLTGAASRGKLGNYFYYYKCKHSRHLNLSANKAHDQFLAACDLMTLTTSEFKTIKQKSGQLMELEMNKNKEFLVEKKQELAKEQEMLHSVEEKWIRGEIAKDTYERWYSTYSRNIVMLKGFIEKAQKSMDKSTEVLERNLYQLKDIKEIYVSANTIQKREFVKQVFDSNLYYESGIYRTPTMMPIMARNSLIMKEKGLIDFHKKRDNFSVIPHSGELGIRTPGPFNKSTVFKTAAIDHSANSPGTKVQI
jgi:site-specific DNA recombinase